MDVYYSPSYLVLGSEFETLEKAQWLVDSLGTTPIADLRIVAPEPSTHMDLSRVHSELYLDAVRTGEPRPLAEAQGIPWSNQVYTAASTSTGGVIAAMRTARAKGVAGSFSSGLHHAKRTTGEGFCTFNGLALAALTALQEGARRVLILDLDAHCGGGTWSLVAHEPRVWHVDISVSDYDRWQPAGHNTLTVLDDTRDYLSHVEALLRALDPHAPSFDLCLYNAGVDVVTGSVADEPIHAGTVAQREKMVFSWCARHALPVAFVLAGGYLGKYLDRSGLVALHRSTLDAASQFGPKRV